MAVGEKLYTVEEFLKIALKPENENRRLELIDMAVTSLVRVLCECQMWDSSALNGQATCLGPCLMLRLILPSKSSPQANHPAPCGERRAIT